MKQKLINSWKQYHENIGLDVHHKDASAFKWFDAELLYSFVRILKPTKIIEMSPDKGWTSRILIKACQDNEQKCQIFSFDLHDKSKNLDMSDEFVARKLITGNVKKGSLTEDHIKNCDFMFIDSDHSYDFGKWYSENILPKLDPNVYIWVHDWPTYEANAWDGHVLIDAGYNNRWGEPKAVKEHFVDVNGHSFLNTTELYQELFPDNSYEDINKMIVDNGCLSQLLQRNEEE